MTQQEVISWLARNELSRRRRISPETLQKQMEETLLTVAQEASGEEDPDVMSVITEMAHNQSDEDPSELLSMISSMDKVTKFSMDKVTKFISSVYPDEEMDMQIMLKRSDDIAVALTDIINHASCGGIVRGLCRGEKNVDDLVYDYLEEVIMLRANHVNLAPEKVARILNDLCLCNTIETKTDEPTDAQVGTGLDDLAQ